MKNEQEVFNEFTDGLKEKELPFVYVEINTWDTMYQVFIPETKEFEKQDAMNLKMALNKVSEILDDYINNMGGSSGN